MRFINIKLFALAAILSLSTPAMADNKSGKPVTCPPASTVAATTMVLAERFEEDQNYWIAASIDEKSYQNPKNKWIYITLVPVNQAVDPQDAINKANAALPTVTAVSKKMMNFEHTRFYGCVYKTSGDYPVLALTHLH